MHKKSLIKQYWRNRNGATVVEYALILAIISVILVMSLPTITPAIAAFFGALSGIFQS
jgi:Flp pilus assembly pilin Flp